MYCNDISQNCACKFITFRTALITSVWIIGLLLGCYLGFQSAEESALIIHNIILVPASFIRLFFALFLPFVLSAFFIRLSVPLLSLFIVFIKAISVGCCSCGMLVVFSSAGWLIRFLLLFSDSLVIVLLLWFWIRNIAGDRRKFYFDLLLCSVLVFFISCIDYFAVSPFLATLFNM